jgi:hypothetical protein
VQTNRVAWQLSAILAAALLGGVLWGVQLYSGLVGCHVCRSSLILVTVRKCPTSDKLLMPGQTIYPWPGQLLFAFGPRASSVYQIYRRGPGVEVVCSRSYLFPWCW